MSNMTLFKSGSVIPDYLREASDATTRDIAGSSGGKQISIKGGVWRMVVGRYRIDGISGISKAIAARVRKLPARLLSKIKPR